VTQEQHFRVLNVNGGKWLAGTWQTKEVREKAAIDLMTTFANSSTC
jgi:hypothetical protein